MDPLRAGAVILLEDGFRYLCDAACRQRFYEGERAPVQRRQPPPSTFHRRPPSTPGISMPSAAFGGQPRRSDTPSGMSESDRDLPLNVATPLAPLSDRVPRVPTALGVAFAAVGAFLALWPQFPMLPLWSATATTLATAAAFVGGWPTRREVPWPTLVAGPFGAALAAWAALWSPEAPSRAGLIGAAIAAMVVVVRPWLDARARYPVRNVAHRLRARLPSMVRVPRATAAAHDEAVTETIAVDQLRTGDEFLVTSGEVVPVDGVVGVGQAEVHLFPSTTTAAPRGPGDPLMAGARVRHGALRIVATRVGDERAMARINRFGAPRGDRAAPIMRLAEQVTRWGGLAALVGAAVGLALANGTGTTAQLSAAAAVLLAAPLLAIRRAVESPLVAAGAIAAERGIVFESARDLDNAGRTSVIVLADRGTVTEGRPDVVEVQPIGDATVDGVLGLVAGAQTAAEGHPIAQALLRHADGRGVPTEALRRATFIPGRGVRAVTSSGELIVVGNRQLLLDEGVSVAVVDDIAARAERKGHSFLFFGQGGRARAVISLRDEPRLGVRAAVQRIFDLQNEVVLISGDHRPTVEMRARHLDIGNVRAELLPDERGAEVKRLSEGGGKVGAVGRAESDGSILAAADVPVALGAAGGNEQDRGITVATGDLRDAAAALWIAHAARSGALRAARVAVVVGLAIAVAAALGFLAPAAAALLALGIDSYALPAGARLLRRVELRLPAPS